MISQKAKLFRMKRSRAIFLSLFWRLTFDSSQLARHDNVVGWKATDVSQLNRSSTQLDDSMLGDQLFFSVSFIFVLIWEKNKKKNLAKDSDWS